MTEEQLAQIKDYAYQGFTIERIARRMHLDATLVREQWEDPQSQIRQAYDDGVIDAEYQKAKTLREKAEKGNMTALQILEKNDKEQSLRRRKEEIFGRPFDA